MHLRKWSMTALVAEGDHQLDQTIEYSIIRQTAIRDDSDGDTKGICSGQNYSDFF